MSDESRAVRLERCACLVLLASLVLLVASMFHAHAVVFGVRPDACPCCPAVEKPKADDVDACPKCPDACPHHHDKPCPDHRPGAAHPEAGDAGAAAEAGAAEDLRDAIRRQRREGWRSTALLLRPWRGWRRWKLGRIG